MYRSSIELIEYLDNNLESNLPTSSLLKIHSLYKFCYKLRIELEICVVSKLKYKSEMCGWRFTSIYTIATSVKCHKCHRFYWLSQFTQKYNGLLIKSHKSRCGRL